MLRPLPKKYRHKYKKELSWDEEVVIFIVKAVSSVTLFFMVAVGMDVYHLFH